MSSRGALCAISKFHSVGPVTGALMNTLGIYTGLDLRRWSRADLAAQFGKGAEYLFGIARRIDHRPAEADRIRKSVGAENTFEQDLLQWDEAQAALEPILTKVCNACERGGHSGRTVTVKAKSSDFHQVTRSCTLPALIDCRTALERTSVDLLRSLFPFPRSVRLIGITASNLSSDGAASPAQPLSFE